MRERKLHIEPFEYLNILDVHINKQVNEHGTALVTGTISSANEDRYVDDPHSGRNLRITARNEDGEDDILFSGLIQDVAISTVNGLRTLTVKAITYSHLADITEVIRTYQNTRMTYRDVANVLGKDSPEQNYLVCAQDKAIGRLLVQYRETNWAFAKRIASRLNTCVVADCKLNYPYIAIGLPSRKSPVILQSDEYRMKKDIGAYLDLNAHLSHISESCALAYEVVDREILDLCD